MVEDDKITITYTKGNLIDSISRECNQDKHVVKMVYDKLEELVSRRLSCASEDADVVIRLFEGITFSSTFVPEQVKVNNLTGSEITASSKIRPKANITRNYKEKITERGMRN